MTLVELADALGIRLTQTEAGIFASRLHEHIAAMEAFLELRIEEHRPLLRHLERDAGYPAWFILAVLG
jgi:hypothetical protein